MKTRTLLSATLSLAALFTINDRLSSAFAQGTAFTYQGRLNANGGPANGSYDLTFTLFSVTNGGGSVAGPLTNSATAVSNGLFTATIDFGTGVFNGTSYWLQIGVQTNGGSGFSTLAPRQPLTPTPYAIYSANAGNALTAASATTAGSATSSTTASTAVTATNFSGPLAGDVTGTEGATVVSTVGGVTAANVASGANAANAATSAATANTIVKRDGTGSFSAASLTLNGNLNLPASTATVGIIYSGGSPFIHAFGASNFFAGAGAGNLTLTGVYNTAEGQLALHNNTTGYYNTADGQGALYFNTTGSCDTAIGQPALKFNTTGAYNTAVGEVALYLDTTGSNNTALGHASLMNDNIGSNNAAIGESSLEFDTAGSYNTADGQAALRNNTTGFNNTAIGQTALYSNTLGNNNIAIGFQAGGSLTTETNDIDIGNPGVAGESNTVRIGTLQTATYLAGTVYANNVQLTSDRNAKENFAPINAGEVLAKGGRAAGDGLELQDGRQKRAAYRPDGAGFPSRLPAEPG